MRPDRLRADRRSGPCLFCGGTGEPLREYARGVQVPGSKEQLAQEKALAKAAARGRGRGRGRGQGRGRGRGRKAAGSDEGVIIAGGRSSVNPEGASSAGSLSKEELEAKAKEAKDRLLEFDRTTARRTQVRIPDRLLASFLERAC